MDGWKKNKNMKKQMDGWMDRKKIDGWLDGQKQNRWIRNGLLDGQKKWMVRCMDINNRWIVRRKDNTYENRWMVGWIKIDEKNRWIV